MAIPVATTTITVLRATAADAFDRAAPVEVIAGVRAVIGSHSGVETNTSGASQTRQARLDCDPVDLRHDDRVRDDQTGETWHVVWCARRQGLGLDHTVADLISITDRAAV
jgi:hypothetical protein